MWHDLLTSGLFGLCGSFLFAGSELGAALWGNTTTTAKMRKLAWLRFSLAVVAGPIFAVSVAPIVVSMFPVSNLYASSAVIGVVINPCIKQITAPGFIRRIFAMMLRGLANQLHKE